MTLPKKDRKEHIGIFYNKLKGKAKRLTNLRIPNLVYPTKRSIRGMQHQVKHHYCPKNKALIDISNYTTKTEKKTPNYWILQTDQLEVKMAPRTHI